MRHAVVPFALFLAVGALGCADIAEPPAAGSELARSTESLESDATAARSRHVMLRNDTRRCVYPLCGGYWVSDVNRARTTCADGSRADECYVADVDVDALGLSVTQRYELLAEAGAGHAILQGRMASNVWDEFGEVGLFVADGAWTAASDQRPIGVFQQPERLPILCIVEPCFDIRSQILNRRRSFDFSGIDFSRVDTDDETVEAAYAALDSGDLLVAGVPRRDNRPGPAGTYGRTLRVSQLYLPYEARECVDDLDCTSSVYTRPVEGVEDCYCPTCPVPMSAEAALRNGEGWRTHCSAILDCIPPPCPAPPEVGCFEATCEFDFDGLH